MRAKKKNFCAFGIGGELVGVCDDGLFLTWTVVALKIFFLCWIWNYTIRVSRKRFLYDYPV